MSANKTKFAIIVAGGNGAGKSTFISTHLLDEYSLLKPSYINADDWQKQTFGVFDNTTSSHAKQAQEWAENERKSHLALGKSFIAETVFSHPSKVDLIKEAKEKGFAVNLYHIGLNDPDIALDRISERVSLGGHDVDPDKVKSRYERIKNTIVEAIKYADKTFVFDNGVMYRPHQKILSLENNNVISIHCDLPDWVKETYKEPLDNYYNRLKEQFSTLQKINYADLESVIKENFKNNPDLLSQKLEALKEKIPVILENGIEIEKHEKDKGR